jgi:hypothetical protein
VRDPVAAECGRLARYLLGVAPPEALVARYHAANALLFPEPPSAEDRAILDLAARRPWALPCLDAALALLRPDALLRRKIVLLLAILETAPELAERFEPESPGALRAFSRLAASGLSAALHAAAGALLLALFARPSARAGAP